MGRVGVVTVQRSVVDFYDGEHLQLGAQELLVVVRARDFEHEQVVVLEVLS